MVCAGETFFVRCFVLCDCDVVAFLEVSFFPVSTLCVFCCCSPVRHHKQSSNGGWDVTLPMPTSLGMSGSRGVWRASAQNGQFAGLSWRPPEVKRTN
jgi:hypothetical protein